MNELLKAYIEKKQAELLKQQQQEQQARQQKQSEQKAELLIREGLYEKVYSGKSAYDAKFPYREWDPKEQKYRCYKCVPIEVTDEEYEEFKKYYEYKKKAEDAEKAAAEMKRKAIPEQKHEKINIVAAIFTWMAWIILVGGFVLGIVMGRQVDMAEMMKIPTGDSFCFVLAFFIWLASSISAMPFFGFAEIIKLLEKIKNK